MNSSPLVLPLNTHNHGGQCKTPASVMATSSFYEAHFGKVLPRPWAHVQSGLLATELKAL
jgi:hypothetical protein